MEKHSDWLKIQPMRHSESVALGDCSEGLTFTSCPPQPLSLFAIQFLNAVGDLLDLIPALSPGARPPLGGLRWPEMGHCSALIKVRGH